MSKTVKVLEALQPCACTAEYKLSNCQHFSCYVKKIAGRKYKLTERCCKQTKDLICKKIPLLLGIIIGLVFVWMITGPEVICSLGYQGGKVKMK